MKKLGLTFDTSQAGLPHCEDMKHHGAGINASPHAIIAKGIGIGIGIGLAAPTAVSATTS